MATKLVGKTMAHNHLPLIGILGDGQLSMMMAQAYQEIGGKVFVFGVSQDSPAGQVADRFFVGDSSNADDLLNFFNEVDVVTLENEFLDSQLLTNVSTKAKSDLLPDPARYGLIEDKLSENHFFQSLGADVGDFFEVKSENDLIEVPGYLKLAKGGYDGVGTFRVDTKEQAVELFEQIKSSGVVIFERAVDFKKELSVIAVAGKNELIFYPVVETHQEQGTCRYVSYPAGISEAVEDQAKQDVTRIMQELGTRGLFAFEYFLTHDDRLILNESAPRPHNSGHITLDMANCSQFENHMRAVAGLELIQPELVKESGLMLNLLGTQDGPFDSDKVTSAVGDKDLSLMLYGKKQSRIKRKMGHINFWGDDQWSRAQKMIDELTI